MGFEDALWAMAGKQFRADYHAHRAPLDRAVAEDLREGLEGVDFASTAARELAESNGLFWGHFENVAPSSVRGYGIGDVRALIQRMGAANEPEINGP